MFTIVRNSECENLSKFEVRIDKSQCRSFKSIRKNTNYSSIIFSGQKKEKKKCNEYKPTKTSREAIANGKKYYNQCCMLMCFVLGFSFSFCF